MRRKTWIIGILVLLSTMYIMTSYEIMRVDNEQFELVIQYDLHKCDTSGSTSFYHTYDSSTIRVMLSVNTYFASISSLYVFGYPVWQDVSEWSEGITVTIGSFSFDISSEYGNWKAHTGDSDTYTSLYYDKGLGILTRSYYDGITLGSFGFHGYSINIDMGPNNVGDLKFYVTGVYLITNNLLLVGIFIEGAIISWIYYRGRRKKGTKSEQ